MTDGLEVSPFNSGLFESLTPSPYRITPTNHAAYVLMPALGMIAVTVVVVFVKVHTAWTIFRALRMDDYTLLAAMAFYVAHVVTLCMSVRHGLGAAAERLTLTQTRKLSQLYLASNILLYPLLACAKVATAMLVTLIQPHNFRWLLWAICAVAVAWAITAIIATSKQCSPDPWALGPTETNNCIQQYSLQIGLKIVDMLTDIALAVVPGLLFKSVNISRHRRVVVVFLFALRIITPIFTLVTVFSQSTYYSTPTPSRPFAAAAVSPWTSFAAGTSLITACIPSIRRFIQDHAAGVSIEIIGDGDIPLSSMNASRSGSKNTLKSRTAVSKAWMQRGMHVSQQGREKGRVEGMNDDGIDGESRKGLTSRTNMGHIIQTRDFMVHAEQAGDVRRERRSRNLSRASSENSLIFSSQGTEGIGRAVHLDDQDRRGLPSFI